MSMQPLGGRWCRRCRRSWRGRRPVRGRVRALPRCRCRRRGRSRSSIAPLSPSIVHTCWTGRPAPRPSRRARRPRRQRAVAESSRIHCGLVGRGGVVDRRRSAAGGPDGEVEQGPLVAGGGHERDPVAGLRCRRRSGPWPTAVTCVGELGRGDVLPGGAVIEGAHEEDGGGVVLGRVPQRGEGVVFVGHSHHGGDGELGMERLSSRRHVHGFVKWLTDHVTGGSTSDGRGTVRQTMMLRAA